MLGSAGPLDRDLVRAWMALDWQDDLSGRGHGAAAEASRRAISTRCSRQPLPQIPLDGALIEAARATFSRVPLASRVYSRIVAFGGGAARCRPWRPADALGAAGASAFSCALRASR